MEQIKNLTSDKKNLAIGAALATISGIAYSMYVGQRHKKPKEENEKTNKTEKKKSSKGLTKDFWRQIDYILKICVPSLKSKEFLLMTGIAGLQVGATSL